MDGGAFSVGSPAHLSFLDLACSMPLGWNGDRPRAPRPSSLENARAEVFSSSFGRGPCYIPFSGGRESSMWLAIATNHARSRGHEDPIPVTLRHPGLTSAQELEVGERVVAHLGLEDWERVEADDLDLIGALAGSTLARIGPFWPANAYTMAPLIEAARGGVFVFITGLADFFSWWRWAPLAGFIAARRRPSKRDLALLGTALMPVSLRVRAARRRGFPPPMPWLRPVPERDALALLRRRQADVPIRFDRAMVMQLTHRCFDGAASTFSALGEALGTSVDQPLRRPGVVESFAGAGGGRGFRGPGDMLRAMCGDLLPSDLLARRSGTDLTRVFFGEASREFAANWSGAGLDESMIDAAALRRSWLSDRPDPRAACLLQYAWLTEQQSVAGAGLSTGELVLTNSNQREAA